MSVSTSSDANCRRNTWNDTVWDSPVIPGSPALSLPELLLEQAEITLSHSSPSKSFQCRTASPGNQLLLQSPTSAFSAQGAGRCQREWTRADWKSLDACFTEERLEIAARKALGNGQLANVEDVNLDDVVVRFVRMMGGHQAMCNFGRAWGE
jgi:hypothetical protein